MEAVLDFPQAVTETEEVGQATDTKVYFSAVNKCHAQNKVLPAFVHRGKRYKNQIDLK